MQLKRRLHALFGRRRGKSPAAKTQQDDHRAEVETPLSRREPLNFQFRLTLQAHAESVLDSKWQQQPLRRSLRRTRVRQTQATGTISSGVGAAG